MQRPVHVLLIEDSPSDAALLQAHLETGGAEFAVDWVPTFEEGKSRATTADCALLDLTLPDGRGLETVEGLASAAPGMPVIVLTGFGDEADGIEAVRLGAQDYLLKDDLKSGELGRAVRYAIERKHAEQERLALTVELEERNRQLALSNHAIFDQSLSGMAQLDPEARILAANNALGRLVGAPSGELIGRALADLFGPRHGGALAAAVSSVSLQGRTHSRDAVLIRDDGTTRLTTLQLSRLTMTATGEPVVLLTANDITDGSSAMLRQAQDQKLDELSRLASGLAHEIRSPLQYVTTSLDYARERVAAILRAGHPGSPEDQFDLTEAMLEVAEGVQRISEIVQAMTAAAQSGDATELHSLTDALAFPLAVARGQAPAGTVFQVHRSDAPQVAFNMGLVQQVVLNLLVNAVHAIEERAQQQRHHAGVVDISLDVDDQWVRLHIKDNGVGMSEAIIANAAEPFFTTKAPGRGTGQGLALVREIMQQHGGTVTLDSVKGDGTTATAWFPRESGATSGEATNTERHHVPR